MSDNQDHIFEYSLLDDLIKKHCEAKSISLEEFRRGQCEIMKKNISKYFSATHAAGGLHSCLGDEKK